jgi:hypothetical protein
MRRAKHPTPYLLKKFLQYNHASGYYEITQDDITYHLTLEQTILETIEKAAARILA